VYHLLQQVLEESGAPEIEDEIQHAFIPSIENASNAAWMASQWEEIELLLSEEHVEALLRHPSREIRTSTLMRLGYQGDQRAIDGLLALLQETTTDYKFRKLISLLGRFDDKRIGASQLALFPHNTSWFNDTRMTLLTGIQRVADQQIAEALLNLALEEEITSPEYLSGGADNSWRDHWRSASSCGIHPGQTGRSP
jgi:HEAT repeat protein